MFSCLTSGGNIFVLVLHPRKTREEPGLPKVHDVLEREFANEPAVMALPGAVLAGDVVEVFLATGAPCESHSGAFAPWPGAERDVIRWFRLADGSAVGVRGAEGKPCGVALWRPERNG